MKEDIVLPKEIKNPVATARDIDNVRMFYGTIKATDVMLQCYKWKWAQRIPIGNPNKDPVKRWVKTMSQTVASTVVIRNKKWEIK